MEINFKIRTKLTVFIISCLLIVFGALNFYINLIIKPKNISETKSTISKLVESKSNEIGAWINKKLIEYRTISSVPAFYSMDVREITPFINRFTNMYMRNGEEMETFSYIGKNGFCWINSQATEELMDYNDYRLAYQNESEFIIGLPVLNKNNRQVMLFYYPVIGYGDEKEALICSAVPAVGLKEAINSANIHGGKTWVMDKEHNIISTNSKYFYKNYLGKEALEEINLGKINSVETMDIMDAEGDPATLFLSPVYNYSNWVTCTLVKNSILSRPTDEMVKGSLILFISLLILTILLGFFLSNSVMKPIKNLQDCMNRVEDGHLDSYYDMNSKRDEIYDLGISYNKMLDEITNLISRIYKEQNEKRQAEMLALQAQIKPHFLYNTLDNIKWMAKKQGAEEVAKTITSLSNLFRIFLSNGQEFITIKDEFKHTRSYLDIQSVRYKEKLSYEMDLPEEIKNLMMVKILVQPIVENAIYHGIKPKDVEGKISIKGFLKEENVEICIEDNGIGMDENELSSLREGLEKMDSSEHFGLVNISRRLKMIYGQEGKLFIESEKGIGTRVKIVIPVREEVECIGQ